MGCWQCPSRCMRFISGSLGLAAWVIPKMLNGTDSFIMLRKFLSLDGWSSRGPQ